MLPESLKRDIAKKFAAELQEPVTLVFFASELAPECQDARLLLRDLAELSDKINIINKNHLLDKEDSAKFGIDKIPAIVPLGKDQRDFGICFYGTPEGYELGSLLEAIRIVSQEKSALSETTQQQLAAIDKAVHIQVFSTPSCPFCPRAVQMALHAALSNENIIVDAVSINLYPHLANLYSVKSVPLTIINDRIGFNGGLAENLFLEQIQAAIAEPDQNATAGKLIVEP